MFLKNSRYAGLPTERISTPEGSVELVRLRALPPTTGQPHALQSHEQLDALSEQHYGGDASRFWHIADANSELEAAALSRQPGRLINLPEN